MTNIRMGMPQLGQQEVQALLDCINRKQLSMGSAVKQFEADFSELHDGAHALSTTSGTTALHLAMKALRVGPGDEVIVPATTYIATANAVSYVGATVKVCDVDPASWTLDFAKLEKLIGPKTKAIVAVHLFGNVCNMSMLRELCDKYGLNLIEDACEALGATYNKQRVGLLSDIGVFSFYGNKTISTGEGGMLITKNYNLYYRAFHLRGVAQTHENYFHDDIGFNYRMTEMQGALGVVQLKRLANIILKRQEIYGRYQQAFSDYQLQTTCQNTEHGVWAFAMLLPAEKERIWFQHMMEVRDIETRYIFPSLTMQPMYKDAGDTPIANILHRRGVMLPLHTELSYKDVDYVIETAREILK